MRKSLLLLAILPALVFAQGETSGISGGGHAPSLTVDVLTVGTIDGGSCNGCRAVSYTTADSGIVVDDELANQIGLAGSATTKEVTVTVTGSDSNVSLGLRPKGTGVVNFGGNGIDAGSIVDTGQLTIMGTTTGVDAGWHNVSLDVLISTTINNSGVVDAGSVISAGNVIVGGGTAMSKVLSGSKSCGLSATLGVTDCTNTLANVASGADCFVSCPAAGCEAAEAAPTIWAQSAGNITVRTVCLSTCVTTAKTYTYWCVNP